MFTPNNSGCASPKNWWQSTFMENSSCLQWMPPFHYPESSMIRSHSRKLASPILQKELRYPHFAEMHQKTKMKFNSRLISNQSQYTRIGIFEVPEWKTKHHIRLLYNWHRRWHWELNDDDLSFASHRFFLTWRQGTIYVSISQYLLKIRQSKLPNSQSNQGILQMRQTSFFYLKRTAAWLVMWKFKISPVRAANLLWVGKLMPIELHQ